MTRRTKRKVVANSVLWFLLSLAGSAYIVHGVSYWPLWAFAGLLVLVQGFCQSMIVYLCLTKTKTKR